MVELVFVIVIIGVLTAIAIPAFTAWREGLESRTSARGVSMMLRNARSNAISKHVQYGVEIDAANSRYRLRQGNRAYNSSWADLAACPPLGTWTDLPASVKIAMVDIDTPNLSGIAFFPNGTSTVSPIIPNRRH